MHECALSIKMVSGVREREREGQRGREKERDFARCTCCKSLFFLSVLSLPSFPNSSSSLSLHSFHNSHDHAHSTTPTSTLMPHTLKIPPDLARSTSYVSLSFLIFLSNLSFHHSDRKNPPPPGGVSYLLCSLIKNPEEEDPPRRICTRCFVGGPLPPGS